MVQMLRNSLQYVSYQGPKELVSDLKGVYQAATEEAGRRQLDHFGEKWDRKYPLISKSWNKHWSTLSTFFCLLRRWKINNWDFALNQFVITFEERKNA